jgi:hypothetical protein
MDVTVNYTIVGMKSTPHSVTTTSGGGGNLIMTHTKKQTTFSIGATGVIYQQSKK